MKNFRIKCHIECHIEPNKKQTQKLNPKPKLNSCLERLNPIP